jgi:uncharacterized membrane protein
MFGKMKLLWELFQSGKQVANKEFWLKQQSVVVPALVSLLLVGVELGKAFGVNIPLDSQTCYMLAGLLYFGVNTVILFITNHRLGFKPAAVRETSVREAQQALPSPSEASSAAQESPVVPHVSKGGDTSTGASSTLSDDVLERAREWLKHNSTNGKVEQYDVFQSK